MNTSQDSSQSPQLILMCHINVLCYINQSLTQYHPQVQLKMLIQLNNTMLSVCSRHYETEYINSSASLHLCLFINGRSVAVWI